MAGRDANFMREIARKGGLSTAARAKKDSTYYQRIGAMGGRASGKPKKRRKKNELANPKTIIRKPKPVQPPSLQRRPPPLGGQTDALGVLDDLIGGL